jgi:hypothetical protein
MRLRPNIGLAQFCTRFLWFATLVLAGGCDSPHGGPACLYWFMPPAPTVTGDGSSPESALRIRHASSRDLPAVESSWLFRRYATTYEIMDRAFEARVNVKTEQIGKRVYHLATLAMPDGTTRIAYFDVTDFR